MSNIIHIDFKSKKTIYLYLSVFLTTMAFLYMRRYLQGYFQHYYHQV